jgi:multisubunit Na+/H+ antiporter MnhG subunit
MFTVIYRILRFIARHRKPLPRDRSATVAAIIGLLFGGIGVGIYFRSFLDFVLCSVLTLVASMAFVMTESVMTLLLCATAPALYGFHRVRASNVKRGVAPAGT